MSFRFADPRDIKEYEAGLSAYLRGEMSEARFTPFRLQMGIYGQRQEGVQMVRIKLPAGRLTPEQLRVIGEVCDAYGGRLGAPKLVHITTRQDIQIHFVDLKDTPKILWRLAEVGLTTREACGNTVRNVTSCFLAGRCPAQRADVSVHARVFAEHFLRHPLTQQFPRKFKVCFSGCEADCARAGMHDIGFVATEKDGKPGFAVWAAGGLSTQPRGAIRVEEWIPQDQILWVGEALMRIHFFFSDRKRRARARMKYVAERLGEEGFLAEYQRQKAAIAHVYAKPNGRLSGIAWHKPKGEPPRAPVDAVRQPDGRWAVFLHLFRGDLTPAQCEGIATLCARFGIKELQTTQEQGLVLLDVPEEALASVKEGLETLGLRVGGARGLADPVVCPGASSCRLAITTSRDLVAALQPELEARAGDPRLSGISVKVSGCQHSCGQHHVADIGLHGLARKVRGRAVPHYQLHLGGSGKAGEGFGMMTIPVPAKRAPEAVAQLLDAYRNEGAAHESFRDWVQRTGVEAINARLAPLAEVKDEELEALVQDWGKAEAFSTKENKPGECAAAVVGMTDARIAEAQYELLLARAHLDAMFWDDARSALERAAETAASAFLIQTGEEEGDPPRVARVLSAWAQDAEVVQRAAEVLAKAGASTPEALHGWAQAVAAWVELAARRFAPVRETESSTTEASRDEEALPVLDLTGVACPMNFVKTKVRLATLPVGARLAVILDDGEPIANVPRSLEDEGQKVLAREKLPDGRWRIVVERRR